jgi:hypothetical protein
VGTAWEHLCQAGLYCRWYYSSNQGLQSYLGDVMEKCDPSFASTLCLSGESAKLIARHASASRRIWGIAKPPVARWCVRCATGQELDGRVKTAVRLLKARDFENIGMLPALYVRWCTSPMTTLSDTTWE